MPADWKPLKSSLSRGAFVLIIAFFAIQIAFDLAHSVTAFPFVHYGMFSESFSAPDSLLRYTVIVDGRPLEPDGFPIYRWDMIQQPLTAIDRQTATNDFAFDKSKLAAAFPAGYSRVSANLDNSPTLATDFPDWYRNYLSRLIGQPIHTLQVNRTWYRYKDNQFILVKVTSWINRQW
ncbi:MAG TPA: hypothetical protein VFE32_11255 [Puia sp.]|nr:hypothetical protein [Puia sp.]